MPWGTGWLMAASRAGGAAVRRPPPWPTLATLMTRPGRQLRPPRCCMVLRCPLGAADGCWWRVTCSAAPGGSELHARAAAAQVRFRQARSARHRAACSPGSSSIETLKACLLAADRWHHRRRLSQGPRGRLASSSCCDAARRRRWSRREPLVLGGLVLLVLALAAVRAGIDVLLQRCYADRLKMRPPGGQQGAQGSAEGNAGGQGAKIQAAHAASPAAACWPPCRQADPVVMNLTHYAAWRSSTTTAPMAALRVVAIGRRPAGLQDPRPCRATAQVLAMAPMLRWRGAHTRTPRWTRRSRRRCPLGAPQRAGCVAHYAQRVLPRLPRPCAPAALPECADDPGRSRSAQRPGADMEL